MIRRSILVLTTVLTLTLAGCQSGTSKSTPTATPTTAATGQTTTVTLATLNTSGESGTATLTDMGNGQTHVVLAVTGEPADGNQPAHIHNGACANLGSVKFPLSPVLNGASETTVPDSYGDLTSMLYSINVHQSATNITTYVACGTINPNGTMPAAGGTVTPTTGMTNTVTMRLGALNNSGESGTATLTDMGNGLTHVVLTLTGEGSADMQPAHIHAGTCATLGTVKYPLSNVISGTSDSMVSASLANLMGSPYAINVHQSPANIGTYVACGNIPAGPATTGTMTPTTGMTGTIPGPITMTLSEINNSNESGLVLLIDMGHNQTHVVISVTGEPTGASQPAHIHDGACGPSLGAVKFPLGNIVSGTSESTVSDSLADLMNGNYAINVHQSTTNLTTYMACGNIPTPAMAATTPTPTAMTTVSVTISALNSSGENGTITLTDMGGENTHIVLNVTGEPAGASQPATLYNGTCVKTGTVRAQLNPLVNGASASDVDEDLNDLLTGGYTIALHESATNLMVATACGDLHS